MRPASLREIKTELQALHPSRLLEVCLQVARYRKENKELLSYLLFGAENEQEYIREVKAELEEMFKEVRKGNSYHAKKTIRKILGFANKQIKYSGLKQTEVEILIHFCKLLRKSGISLPVNTVLGNLYFRQVIRVRKAVATLHEDLQFDYSEEMKAL